MRNILAFVIPLSLSIYSCTKFEPKPPKDEEILDGPIEGLSYEEQLQFLKGDIAFNDDVFTVEKGLGPLFVSTSCGSCHAGDGKGHPFTTLTRFGQYDSTGNKFLHLGGPQLQNRAIPGYIPEQIPSGATYSKITPPANTGLGYLEAVTDADILALADPADVDGDGISGRPNWTIPAMYLDIPVNSISNNGKYIGRFGKKAAAFNLLHQTVLAYNQDMGITSIYEPYDTYDQLEKDPEVSNQTIHDVVFYLQTLKTPRQRNTDNENIKEGKRLFIQSDCAKCHIPELKTGYSKIEALSYKTFYPYTDMLLHDMGEGLDDGYTEGSALSSEWRTPALWGMGLSKNSQGGTYYLLHDGRATSIHQAIMLHGGEATNSRNKYSSLSVEQRNQIEKFLESL
ncbi:MAG: c-type cytochrome [Candidatus Kuenenia stuttgartiensis]|nr:c-type cytochrome [Candidatus Kuenenia stuttgartiensis]